jgi:hypothetical protein
MSAHSRPPRYRTSACRRINEVRAALADGEPTKLLGLAECGWLDAKVGVYQLDDPAKADLNRRPLRPELSTQANKAAG